MSAKNKVCLFCGTSFHLCSSCDVRAGWEWDYCAYECWASSFKALRCLALGDKLAALLDTQELHLLREGIEEESHYLDMVLEGTKLPR